MRIGRQPFRSLLSRIRADNGECVICRGQSDAIVGHIKDTVISLEENPTKDEGRSITGICWKSNNTQISLVLTTINETIILSRQDLSIGV